MNTEDSEFKRIEAEAKRRAARDEDDDTQTYTSESAASYSYRCGYEAGAVAEREACARLAAQMYSTIAALKEALAQPEQQAEPPEWPLIKNIIAEYGLDAIAFVAEWKAAQRPWQELTDEEIKSLASWWPSYDQMPALMVLAKDIQNSLKEKNT